MKNLEKHSETELLKLINDIKKEHDSLKDDIIKKTYEIEEQEKDLNIKIEMLSEIEKKYIEIIEEFEKR